MKFWLAASFLCVFAAGSAVSYLALRFLAPAADRPSLPLTQLYSDAPYLIASDEIYADLGLDARQRSAMKTLLDRHYDKIREVRESLITLWADLREGVRGTLTPAQWERFQEIQRDYGEREIQARVSRRLVDLAQDLDLMPEQEPLVYMILYDAELEGRKIWEEGRKSAEDRDSIGNKFRELFERRDAEIRQVLTVEQDLKFAEIREEESRRRPDRRGGREKGR